MQAELNELPVSEPDTMEIAETKCSDITEAMDISNEKYNV